MKFVILMLSVLMVIRPIVPVLEYAINYEYITKVLCENKFKPQKKCNGKCHLRKELNDVFDDKKSTTGSDKMNLVETVIIFLEKNIRYDFAVLAEQCQPQQVARYTDLYSFCFYKDFFHPPASTILYL